MFETIIWATDGSGNADAALPFALALAERGRTRFVAVHAEELALGRGGSLPLHADEEELESKIRRQAEELRADGYDASFRLITGIADHAARMIADVAREENADVIVTGTRGHGPITGAIVGSVTQRLLHFAPCPVMAVPGAKQLARTHSGELAKAAN